MKPVHLICAALCLLFTVLVPSLTKAQTAMDGEASRAELFLEVEDIAPGRPFWLALRIAPDAGYATAWRNPGTEVSPPNLSWSLPQGFLLGEVHWPSPRILGPDVPLDYGYRGAITVLQEIIPPKQLTAGVELTLALDASWPLCRAECVVENGRFELQMVPGEGQPLAANAMIFQAARARLPLASPWPIQVAVENETFDLTLWMDAEEATNVETIRFMPLMGRLVGEEGELRMDKERGGFHLRVERQSGPYIDEVEGLILIFWAGKEPREAYLIRAKNSVSERQELSLAKSRSSLDLDLWLALGFAFLGGLILNLMPCVFPVLTIKIFALVKSSSRPPAEIKLDGLAYTAGILVSFLAVGIILMLVRGLGLQVGWGFQLQSPAFVIFLSLVLTAVGLNFSGLFTLPSALASLGQGLAGKEGASGAFFTGTLATVVATPCTAPFMAPAIGFALAQAGVAAVGVFLALGLGLAAPYLVVSFVPAAYRMFPQPGPWMEQLRKILAWPIYATAIWLLWVLNNQTGSEGLVLAIAALVGLFLLIWVWRAGQRQLRRSFKVAVTGLLALVLGVLIINASRIAPPVAVAGPELQGVETMAYDQETVRNLRLQGKGIFLNVTAAWCITCIVQERLVFDSAQFAEFLSENNIVFMTADWTNPDPEITDLLDRHRRSGIPFYLYYPGTPLGLPVELPVILTMNIIRETISPYLEPR